MKPEFSIYIQSNRPAIGKTAVASFLEKGLLAKDFVVKIHTDDQDYLQVKERIADGGPSPIKLKEGEKIDLVIIDENAVRKTGIKLLPNRVKPEEPPFIYITVIGMYAHAMVLLIASLLKDKFADPLIITGPERTLIPVEDMNFIVFSNDGRTVEVEIYN